MEFREFFEEQERIDESLLGLAKGAWGITKGVANTAAGAMTMGDEAIAKIMGQGTKGRFSRGSDRFSRGVRQIFVGDPPKKEPAEQPNPPEQSKQPSPKEEEKIVFHCGNGHRINAPSASAGKRARCPKCGMPVKVPVPGRREDPPPAPSQPPAEGPRPNREFLKLLGHYRTAMGNNNQNVMRRIQYLMGKADPVYYHHALEKGHFPRRKT